MNKTMSFLGYSPATPQAIGSWKDDFEEIFNDAGQLYLLSKEVYASEEDGEIPAFKYKYGLKCMDMRAFGSDESNIVIELLMVILPEYICEDTKARFLESFGTDEVTEFDMMSESYWSSVCFGSEYVNYDPENLPDGWYDYYYNPLDNIELQGTLNVAAAVLRAIDSMRGFFLDNAWNRIGTCGWDTLKEITIGKDQLKASIARIYPAIA